MEGLLIIEVKDEGVVDGREHKGGMSSNDKLKFWEDGCEDRHDVALQLEVQVSFYLVNEDDARAIKDICGGATVLHFKDEVSRNF